MSIQDPKGERDEHTKEKLRELEQYEMKILAKKEGLWRLKRMALWLSKGDEYMNYFHQYAKNMKNINKIWEMEREDRSNAKTIYQ